MVTFLGKPNEEITSYKYGKIGKFNEKGEFKIEPKSDLIFDKNVYNALKQIYPIKGKKKDGEQDK